MAAWRRKAESLLPEIIDAFEDAGVPTPYGMLPFVRDAHRRDDRDAIARAYAYAQWCHHQRAGSSLPNAVGVAFYEHLFDDWSTRRAVVPWLAPDIRAAITPLWEARLSHQQMTELRPLLAESGEEPWRGLRALASPPAPS